MPDGTNLAVPGAGADPTAPARARATRRALSAHGPTVLRPVRILHVVMRMDRGGIETSLMQLLKTVDRQRYPMDFLVLREQPGQQDDAVRALGSRIIPCPQTRRPWRFARDFARIMREYGPYDVIHWTSY